MRFRVLGLDEDAPSTLENVTQALADLQNESQRPLWLVLIGHGTFDGRTAKFNLPGPDLEPDPLRELLAPVERPLAVINCSSASAPFLEALSTPGRIVITATSVSNEINFARFGGFLAESIARPEADLDKDQQTSLLEAFLQASHLTEQFYEGQGRLATEHPLLDDNGDRRPVPSTGFDGVQPIDRDDPEGLLPDGLLAHQWHLVPSAGDAALSPETIARRNELEIEIAKVRARKEKMPEEEYYAALERLFLEMARLLSGQHSADSGR